MNRIFEKDSIFNLRHVVSARRRDRCFIAYFDGMVDNQVVDLNILRPFDALQRFVLSPRRLRNA